MLHRRKFLNQNLQTTAALLCTPCFIETQRWARASTIPQDEIRWHDVQEWGVEGRGFNDTEAFYDRLPAKAKSTVRESVWGLSRHSAGMLTRFRTDATSLHVSYEVTSKNLAMPHMPATGVSGLDLYAKDLDGRWKWVAVLPPNSPVVEQQWVSGLSPGIREYAVYLPLYNGVKYLKIGTLPNALWEPLPPRTSKPLVFYGTSITQGACATRPGMAHTSILGRRLDHPVINLGFSGSGTMDLSIAELLGEIDAAVYIIDCLPNMTADDVRQRTVPFISKLRSLQPSTPILLVEDRSYSGSWLIHSQRERNIASRTALAEEMSRLRELQVKYLYYLGGESLLGADRDDTTDGSHPSDLGFQRHADAFEPALRSLLSS
jgi:hypothetical protein